MYIVEDVLDSVVISVTILLSHQYSVSDRIIDISEDMGPLVLVVQHRTEVTV